MAYRLAGEELAKLDLPQQCLRSGAQYEVKDSRKIITLRYLNQICLITLPDIEVSLPDSKERLTFREKVLILHYLIRAKGTPPSNELITYKELPSGNIYFPTFAKRTIKPLVRNFSKEANLLLAAAERLGGGKTDHGDIGVTIDAFSRVPITIVLWRGDDEFAPEGSILFDANIVDYLSSEDVTVLCETLTWRLINYLRETQTSPAPGKSNLQQGG